MATSIASLLCACDDTTGSGTKRLDAAIPGTGGNGGFASGGASGAGGMGTGGGMPDARADTGGTTGLGVGGAKLDASLATGGMGAGGVGTGGGRSDSGAGVGGTKPDTGAVTSDATAATGGMIDASSATGGGGGTTSVGAGGVAGGGGRSGADAGSSGIDGKVLSCDQIPGPCSSTTVSNNSTPPTTTSTEYLYDDLGRLIRLTYTSSSGSVSWTARAYDQAGNLIETKNDSCDTSARIGCYWHTYVYDDKGNLLVDNDKGNSASVQPGCTRYTYDDAGLLARSEFFAGCGDTSFDGYVTFEYDSAKRRVAQHSTKENFLGTSSNVAYAYDAADRVIGETYTNKAGSVTVTVAYTLDAAGHVLVRQTRYADGSGDQLVSTYNDKGKELTRKTVALSGGKETRCLTFTYDSCGMNQLTSVSSDKCDGVVSTQETDSYACFGGP